MIYEEKYRITRDTYFFFPPVRESVPNPSGEQWLVWVLMIRQLQAGHVGWLATVGNLEIISVDTTVRHFCFGPT